LIYQGFRQLFSTTPSEKVDFQFKKSIKSYITWEIAVVLGATVALPELKKLPFS
jgi:hypothetical protein